MAHETETLAGYVADLKFEDIPADWVCPVCGARKKDFSPLD